MGMSDSVAIPAAAFDALPFGIFLADAATGEVIPANTAAVKFGRTLPEPVAQAALSGQTLRNYVSGLFDYSTTPYAFGRAVVVVRDASERERELEVLRNAPEGAFLDHSPLPVWAVDIEGRVTLWNRAAERVFGWTAAEVAGKFLPAVPARGLRAWFEMLERVRGGEVIVGWETPRVTKDGGARDTSISLAPLRDSAGRFTGAIAIVADITEKNALERHLRESQKLESIGLLASGIAHDFNNLLTTVIGRASLLADEIEDPHLKSEVGLISQAGERAADLTRQLLAYAGKGKLSIRSLDVSEVVSNTVRLLESSIPKKITLELALAAGLPPVEADPSQVQQVVMNLVINAAEAIGSRAGVVRLSTSGAEPYVCIEVMDNGCGMDEATKAHIFDPFFTTKYNGRGLGLAAVAGIVRGAGGVIEVQSTPGQGTTFKVRLPAAAVPPDAETPDVQLTHDVNGSGGVLIADDDEGVRNAAAAILKRYGYHVACVRNGREALALLGRHGRRFGLVLLDLTMPEMDGADCAPIIRKRWPHLRVLLTSGHNEEEARRLAGTDCVDGFVKKPFRAAALAQHVQRVMATTFRLCHGA